MKARGGHGLSLRGLLSTLWIVGATACVPIDAAREHVNALSLRDESAVQRAALLALFVDREHATQLVFWGDTLHESPTLGVLRESGVSLTARWPDTAALALPMPVHIESLSTLEQHFRDFPDGWEAWFRRFPSSSGLVVLTGAERLADAANGAARAALVIGRTCGEHCHSAWRVTLARDASAGWQTVAVVPLTLRRD